VGLQGGLGVQQAQARGRVEAAEQGDHQVLGARCGGVAEEGPPALVVNDGLQERQGGGVRRAVSAEAQGDEPRRRRLGEGAEPREQRVEGIFTPLDVQPGLGLVQGGREGAAEALDRRRRLGLQRRRGGRHPPRPAEVWVSCAERQGGLGERELIGV
jgi:hypothetical protein